VFVLYGIFKTVMTISFGEDAGNVSRYTEKERYTFPAILHKDELVECGKLQR
jgi:hypothetical protein